MTQQATLFDTTDTAMPIVTAEQEKGSLGHLIDTAQQEAVTIEEQGKPVAVLLSKRAYDALQEELQTLRSIAETAFLMQGKNGERLRASIRDLEEGRVVTKSLEELEAMASDEG